MTTESPSLLLQRAAERLEELGEHYETYRQAQEGNPGEFKSAQARWVHFNVPTGAAHSSAWEWMWIVTPAIAQPLANILRDAAFTLDSHPEYRTHYLSYIALAEAVLATEKEQPA